VDPLVIATILGPLLGAAVGIALDRAFARSPKLLMYFGHVSAHRIPADAGGPDIIVNTHSIWVANTRQSPAHNVKVVHTRLTGINVQVYPVIEHRYEEIAGGGTAIVFPNLPGKSQLQLQYVGVGVITENIMVGCYSDEAVAKVIKVVPMRATPKFVRTIMVALLVIGAAALGYIVVRLALMLWHWIAAQNFL